MKTFSCLFLCTFCCSLSVLPIFAAPANNKPRPKARSTKKASSRESAILYGRGFSYAVSAPVGWHLDSEAGKSQGLSVVFYKRGQSWANGDAVIYINVAGRVPGKTLESDAQDDKRDFLRGDNTINVQPSAPLKTSDGSRVLTQTFLHRSGKPPFEKSAYVQMPTISQTIVLTAKTRLAFIQAQKDFNNVIASLFFITDKVTAENMRRRQR